MTPKAALEIVKLAVSSWLLALLPAPAVLALWSGQELVGTLSDTYFQYFVITGVLTIPSLFVSVIIIIASLKPIHAYPLRFALMGTIGSTLYFMVVTGMFLNISSVFLQWQLTLAITFLHGSAWGYFCWRWSKIGGKYLTSPRNSLEDE